MQTYIRANFGLVVLGNNSREATAAQAVQTHPGLRYVLSWQVCGFSAVIPASEIKAGVGTPPCAAVTLLNAVWT